MPITHIAPGLRRWTAWHDEWQENVGCLAVDTDDGLVLIDPLDPPRGLRRPEHVLLTIHWHARSTSTPHVWAHRRTVRMLANRGVEVGDVVAPGQTLCILEAMKLMNEVKADVEGVVRGVHAENAEPVEFGQLLFELEPLVGRPVL